MFEKEAEEYMKQFIKTHSESDKFINCKRETDNYNVILAQGYELGFQKGAEFGYNKANEWHDLRKDPNDLPKEHISVLVMLEYGVPYISFVSTDKRWFCTNYYTGEDKVIAWKEIVLPKESE